MKSPDEIADMVQKANESQEEGSSLFGMSYEDGVIAALDWIDGHTDDPPIGD